MVKCSYCKLEMKEADSCTLPFLVDFKQVHYKRSKAHFKEPSGRCGDCSIKHGGIHHFGCDVERCPKCGYQLITCSCWEKKLYLTNVVPKGQKAKKPCHEKKLSSD